LSGGGVFTAKELLNFIQNMITIIKEINVHTGMSNQGSVWLLPRKYNDDDMEIESISDVIGCEYLCGPIDIDDCDRIGLVLEKLLTKEGVNVDVEYIADD